MAATRTMPAKSPTVPVRCVRCAIYTRKSTDENLNTDFNSLDAQRESAESYVASQRAEGWVALTERYDDPAFSAATTDRPALQRLLADIEAGKIDAVVVYKIDRLSRSLRDFGKIMETFEQHGVSFISITQRFDTSSSMGKLTLNILMSFAEFERGITRERILDKIAASKRKGRHCGGVAIIGYDVVNKRLVINEPQAKTVRHIFQRFVETGSTTRLADELNRDGYKTKAYATVTGRVMGDKPWTKMHLYALINNPKYIGKVEHKGALYDGEHKALISTSLWDAAHKILKENYAERASRTRAETPALLRGVIKCGACNCAMGPTFTRKNGRTYRFYLCVSASKRGYKTCPVKSVAAGTIEKAVVGQLRAVFRTPELVAKTYREAKARETEDIERLRGNGDATSAELGVLEMHPVSEQDVIEALTRLDPVWDELFPAEQARIVQLLVERVEVSPDGLEVRIRGEGLRSLVAELSAQRAEPKEAAACP